MAIPWYAGMPTTNIGGNFGVTYETVGHPHVDDLIPKSDDYDYSDPGIGEGSDGTDWSAEKLEEITPGHWQALLQSAYDQQSALDEKERQFNSGEAQKNREWQEMMSNSAIQRQVADLEKAGLNKWLAVNNGSINGASTPSGSQAAASSGSQSVAQIYRAFLAYLASLESTALRSLVGVFDFF